MPEANHHSSRRLLIVDDNRAIHDDFRKILDGQSNNRGELDAAEAALYGEAAPAVAGPEFEIVSAYQGQESLALVEESVKAGRPFSIAVVDVRMPPGWDGIETTAKLWQADPDLQVVICTAYSDYSWEAMRARLGASDRLLILKKPFDMLEVQQLAYR